MSDPLLPTHNKPILPSATLPQQVHSPKFHTLEPEAATAAFVYDCDLPHLGAKLEKKDVFELPDGLDAVVKVEARVLENDDEDFLEEADGSSSPAAEWICFCREDRFVNFFLLPTSTVLQNNKKLINCIGGKYGFTNRAFKLLGIQQDF